MTLMHVCFPQWQRYTNAGSNDLAGKPYALAVDLAERENRLRMYSRAHVN